MDQNPASVGDDVGVSGEGRLGEQQQRDHHRQKDRRRADQYLLSLYGIAIGILQWNAPPLLSL